MVVSNKQEEEEESCSVEEAEEWNPLPNVGRITFKAAQQQSAHSAQLELLSLPPPTSHYLSPRSIFLQYVVLLELHRAVELA